MRVEFDNHLVPIVGVGMHTGPEFLIETGIEYFEGKALLLDPREITEIEDPSAVPLVEFDEVLRVGAGEMLANGVGGIDLIE